MTLLIPLGLCFYVFVGIFIILFLIITAKRMSDQKPILKIPKPWYRRYILPVLLFTLFIAIFSAYMQNVADDRSDATDISYMEVERIYSGPVKQNAPTLNDVYTDNLNGANLIDLRTKYGINDLSLEKIKYFLSNTNLVSTEGEVTIKADFVKKGLVYQPTYKTTFLATYILKNNLGEESLISFDFPFPSSTNHQEISNAKLLLNGVEQANSKAKVRVSGDVFTDGLKWEGKIPSKGEAKITVSYDTVGLSQFQYEGMENPNGAQNFKFKVKMEGTRMYDVVSGLSVDKREFGDKSTTLIWDKNSLYTRPAIDVSIGEKLNPSVLVGRVYKTMAPIYLAFIIALIFLAFKFGKKLKVFDLAVITLLFTIFFPFFHYLSSFKIDPTIEIFSSINLSSSSYSMSLYLAFALAFIVIAAILLYLLARTQNLKFTGKFGVPIIMLAMCFFPLVATIPEYFGLLSLIGIILVMIVVIQVRLGLETNRDEK